MTPADLAPFGSQQPLQHARAGEGELQMQLVHAPHQRKIGGRRRTRLVVIGKCLELEPAISASRRWASSSPSLRCPTSQ